MRVPDLDTDILIVGAGLAGGATAYHLTRCSNLRVVLVEKESVPGSHSSGRNAAFVRESMDEPSLQSLAGEGAKFLRTGELAEFHECGLMLLGVGEEEVAGRFKRARGKGLWYPHDGTVDVAALLQSYLADQEIRYNTEVTGWDTRQDSLRVITNQGKIRCRTLVNAAGPWAGQLGDLPLTPMNRHLFQTTPISWVDPQAPFVWDVIENLYFRPESGGLLLSGCDESPAEPGDYRDDPAVLDQLAHKLRRLQPELGDLAIQSGWVGQRVFAQDKNFVIGFDPRNDRVFHVAALGGHGVTTSFAVGRLAAEMIVKRCNQQPNPFDPARLLQTRSSGALADGTKRRSVLTPP